MIAPNRRLVLEAPVRVPDGSGGYRLTWVPQGVVWALIRPGTGRAIAAEGATISRLPLTITLRAAPHGAPSRPVPDQRLREGARIFTILSVSDSADGRWLTCVASEEVAR